jgi:hypothetical protein
MSSSASQPPGDAFTQYLAALAPKSSVRGGIKASHEKLLPSRNTSRRWRRKVASAWDQGIAREIAAPAHCGILYSGGGVLTLYALAGIGGVTAARRATHTGGDTGDVRVARLPRSARVWNAGERLPAGRAGLKHALEIGAGVGKWQARALCGLLRRAADGIGEIHRGEKCAKRERESGKCSRSHVIPPFRKSILMPLIARRRRRGAALQAG